MRILLALALMVASCSVPPREMVGSAPMAQDKQQLKLAIPVADWEPIFFRSINERAAAADLKDLRSTVLINDDLEVRVWRGFGVTALTGYVIKREGGQWSGLKLAPLNASALVQKRSLPLLRSPIG